MHVALVSQIDPDDSSTTMVAVSAPPVSSAPPLEVRHAAFRHEINPAVLAAAVRYAEERSKMVRKAGGRVDRYYARELVQDALADIWIGGVAWDPARCPLRQKILDVVKWRSAQEAQGCRKRPHFSMDLTETPVSREAEKALAHASSGSLTPIALSALARSVVSQLRQLAKGDPAATAVLEAWVDGDFDPEDVRARTGLSDKAYRAARARLTYFVRDMPAYLRDAAVSALRSNQ